MNNNASAPAAALPPPPPPPLLHRLLPQQEEPTLTLSALNGRQEKLELRVAACGIIFFVVNSGLLFLIIVNYLFVVGGIVLTQQQLK